MTVKNVFKPDGTAWANNEIRVSSDPTATDVAVARDVDGDFVVTWAAQNATTDWDVYAQRFSANGTALGSTVHGQHLHGRACSVLPPWRWTPKAISSSPGRASTRSPTRATTDGSGYGIYAQRYSPEGLRVGGIDEIQTINFINNWTGTFRLAFDHDDNPDTPDKVTVADHLQRQHGGHGLRHPEPRLQALGVDTEVSPQGTKINIRFVGDVRRAVRNRCCGSARRLRRRPAARATPESKSPDYAAGDTGEFRVNDTTAGDQAQPSIAMSATGDFVISWTSYGQDGDRLDRGNIYARKFPSNAVYESNSYGQIVTSPATPAPQATPIPLISSLDNPSNHVVPDRHGLGRRGANHHAGSRHGPSHGTGSGTLIAGTNFILTAAHVVTLEGTNADLADGQVTTSFSNAHRTIHYTGVELFTSCRVGIGICRKASIWRLVQLGRYRIRANVASSVRPSACKVTNSIAKPTKSAKCSA